MPSMTLDAALLGLLDLLPVARAPASALVDLDVAEHVRMAVHELVVDDAGDVGQREPALLGGEGGVEEHLEEQVAELLLEVRVPGRRRRASSASIASSDLVGLLEQVAGERAMGLLPIPRALAAQGAHELGEAHELGGDRVRQLGIQSAVRWSGSNDAVELGPRHLERPFVGQAEVLEHDDARRAGSSSTASLMSESTAGVSHCATSSGPRSPAASTANR